MSQGTYEVDLGSRHAPLIIAHGADFDRAFADSYDRTAAVLSTCGDTLPERCTLPPVSSFDTMRDALRPFHDRLVELNWQSDIVLAPSLSAQEWSLALTGLRFSTARRTYDAVTGGLQYDGFLYASERKLERESAARQHVKYTLPEWDVEDLAAILEDERSEDSQWDVLAIGRALVSQDSRFAATNTLLVTADGKRSHGDPKDALAVEQLTTLPGTEKAIQAGQPEQVVQTVSASLGQYCAAQFFGITSGRGSMGSTDRIVLSDRWTPLGSKEPLALYAGWNDRPLKHGVVDMYLDWQPLSFWSRIPQSGVKPSMSARQVLAS